MDEYFIPKAQQYLDTLENFIDCQKKEDFEILSIFKIIQESEQIAATHIKTFFQQIDFNDSDQQKQIFKETLMYIFTSHELNSHSVNSFFIEPISQVISENYFIYNTWMNTLKQNLSVFQKNQQILRKSQKEYYLQCEKFHNQERNTKDFMAKYDQGLVGEEEFHQENDMKNQQKQEIDQRKQNYQKEIDNYNMSLEKMFAMVEPFVEKIDEMERRKGALILGKIEEFIKIKHQFYNSTESDSKHNDSFYSEKFKKYQKQEKLTLHQILVQNAHIDISFQENQMKKETFISFQRNKQSQTEEQITQGFLIVEDIRDLTQQDEIFIEEICQFLFSQPDNKSEFKNLSKISLVDLFSKDKAILKFLEDSYQLVKKFDKNILFHSVKGKYFKQIITIILEDMLKNKYELGQKAYFMLMIFKYILINENGEKLTMFQIFENYNIWKNIDVWIQVHKLILKQKLETIDPKLNNIFDIYNVVRAYIVQDEQEQKQKEKIRNQYQTVVLYEIVELMKQFKKNITKEIGNEIISEIGTNLSLDIVAQNIDDFEENVIIEELNNYQKSQKDQQVVVNKWSKKFVIFKFCYLFLEMKDKVQISMLNKKLQSKITPKIMRELLFYQYPKDSLRFLLWKNLLQIVKQKELIFKFRRSFKQNETN